MSMAVRSVSSESISDHCDGSRSIHDYSRQATVHGASCPTLYREPRARALVRRPSVDFVKLTKQRSRAIIDNYFKATSPPVLEHMSKEILKKISDTEMGKVDLREARRQLTDNKARLHAEVRRKAVRFSSGKERAYKNTFKPAVDDVSEVHPSVDYSLDSNHDNPLAHASMAALTVAELVQLHTQVPTVYPVYVNDLTNATAHMTTTTTTNTTTVSDDHMVYSSKAATNHIRSKPKLFIASTPFDKDFAEAEIDSPHRRAQKTLQSHTKSLQSHAKSHNDTMEMTFSSQEVLQSSQSVVKEKEDDKAFPQSTVVHQNAMLLSTTELTAAHHSNGDDEVDFVAVSTSIQQTSVTDDDNDILNRAQNSISLSAASELMRNTSNLEDTCDSESLSNSFVHCTVSTEQSTISDAPSNSMQPSSISNGGLHLNLSCDHNSEDIGACSQVEDDEEPKHKPVVPGTPLDVDGPLPSQFHNLPFFVEAHQCLGRIPTAAEYLAYRLEKISMDLEWRYPDLDIQFQKIISTLGGNLTYELFHRAALNVQSQAKQMCEGLFMVLRFGRRLFQDFPESASNFTTQWVNEYIVHQGGWDAVTDRYFEEQQTVLSPVTTAEMTGALGASGDGGLQMGSIDHTDGGALTHVVKGNANVSSYPPPKRSVNMSPPVWDISQSPMFTHLERACSVEFLPSVPEVPVNPSPPSSVELPTKPHCEVMMTSQLSEDSLTKSLDYDSIHPHTVSGTRSALSMRPPCPIRRTNSAPQLSNIPLSDSDIEGPPPEVLEKRRGSLQDYYNDVFGYIPFIPIVIPTAAVAIHMALRLSSS